MAVNLIVLVRQWHERAPLLLLCGRQMAIAHDGQQPRLRIGPAQRVETAESPQHGVLYDVLGIAGGVAQPSREPVRGVEMRQNQLREPSALVIHGVKTHGWPTLFPTAGAL